MRKTAEAGQQDHENRSSTANLSGSDSTTTKASEDSPATAPVGAKNAATSATRGTILVVDDEVFIRTSFQLYFDTIGFHVRTAAGGEAATAIFEDESFPVDVVILDLVMPGIQGLELLKDFKARRPDVEVIIATGCGSLSSAIEAMRIGAFDYITKPIINFEEELLQVVEDAMVHRRRRDESRATLNLRGFQGNSEFTIHNLSLFEKFVNLADLAALWRSGEDGAGGHPEGILGKVEELLENGLGVSSGLLLSRSKAGELSPLYSWGKVRPTPLEEGSFSSPELLRAVREAGVLVFPTEQLGIDLFETESVTSEQRLMAIHLPLVLEGAHRGSLFLFFARRAEELKNADFLDNGHPYLLLAPMLGSFFLGVTRDLETV